MYHGAHRSLNCERNGIRDAVVHPNEFYRKAANPENGSGFLGKNLCIVKKIMLFQFQLDQRGRQRSRIDRNIQLFQDVRNRADMILMTVGNDHAADAACIVS